MNDVGLANRRFLRVWLERHDCSYVLPPANDDLLTTDGRTGLLMG
jgi:hypothetical protein